MQCNSMKAWEDTNRRKVFSQICASRDPFTDCLKGLLLSATGKVTARRRTCLAIRSQLQRFSKCRVSRYVNSGLDSTLGIVYTWTWVT